MEFDELMERFATVIRRAGAFYNNNQLEKAKVETAIATALATAMNAVATKNASMDIYCSDCGEPHSRSLACR